MVIDVPALQRNIARMQNACDQNGVELWPHIKTHKCGEIVKLQLAAGAKGITCAKLGEAEHLIGTGVKQIFIAHALVDVRMAPRLRALHDKLERLIFAVTSLEQMPFMERLAQAADLRLPVMVALDTGLHREGCRSLDELKQVFSALEGSRHLEPLGIYTHEGHCYFADQSQREAAIADTHRQLLDALDVVGSQYLLAPGCSASAADMARRERIDIVRPGTYVLGDLSLAYDRKLMAWEDLACTVLATVVDRPEPGLALLDAGSKTFSGDKAMNGASGRWLDDPSVWVHRVNEEHGYLSHPPERSICIGDRLRFVPAHVCTTMNMTDSAFAVQGEEVIGEWKLEARGKVN